MFYALIGVSGLETTKAHRSEEDPVLWVNWESFSTWHDWYKFPLAASKYVIKGIVRGPASGTGDLFIEFPDLQNQGSSWRWTKDKTWLKKWVVSRGAFPLGKERIDEECLNEWFEIPAESEDESVEEQVESENSEYTGLPRGIPAPKSGQVGKKGAEKGTVVTATVPVVAGGAAKVPKRRRGPAKGGVKQKGTKSGGMPRGIQKSRFYDSDSSEPHIPTSRSE